MTASDPRVGEIQADAIEAAALIVYRTSGRKRVMSYEQARAQCESDAREILEAALPHMVADAGAKALEDAALLAEMGEGGGVDSGECDDWSAWLRARVAAVRGGE